MKKYKISKRKHALPFHGNNVISTNCKTNVANIKRTSKTRYPLSSSS
jgi:hypothetical protein